MIRQDLLRVKIGATGAEGPPGPPGPPGADGQDGAQGPPGTTSWNGLTDKPSTFPPDTHSHAQADVTNLVTALAGKEAANANIQAHIASAHAPSDAQKNSDITLAEIEAKLVGQITSHTHPGGGGGFSQVIKAADESKNNSAVVADDNTLIVPLVANTNYALRLDVFWLTNATADLKYRLVFTGTTTRVRRRIKRTATSDTAMTFELKTAFDAADVILSTTGLNPHLSEEIILQVGASGGNLKLQWGQVTSNAGPTTCLEGSYIEYATT